MTILGYSLLGFIIRIILFIVLGVVFFVHFAYLVSGIAGYINSCIVHKHWVLCKARVSDKISGQFDNLVPVLEWVVNDCVFTDSFALAVNLNIDDEVDFYYNPDNEFEGEPALDKSTYLTMFIDGLINSIIFTVGLSLLFVI